MKRHSLGAKGGVAAEITQPKNIVQRQRIDAQPVELAGIAEVDILSDLYRGENEQRTVIAGADQGTGVLEFTTLGGETFTLRPGDVLLAEDHTGSGHKWRLINDEPWKRAYVIFKEGANTQFVADAA